MGSESRIGQDWKSERSASLSIAMTSQIWHVFDDYQPDGEIIRPIGEAKTYFPMAIPGLPYELAKVQTDDVDSTLNFVRRRGLLGRRFLGERQAPRSDDTFDFIWGHSSTIRNILALIEALNNKTPQFLEQLLDTIVQELPYRVASKELYQCWFHMDGAQGREVMELTRHSPKELALKIIANSISENLEGTRPFIEKSRAYENQLSDSILSRLQFTFRYQAMIQCAYWHIAMLLTRNGTIRQCHECSGFFECTDKRQTFATR